MLLSGLASLFIITLCFAFAQGQGCTSDPCFPEFSSGLDSLTMRLQSDIGSMMSAFSLTQLAQQDLQKCQGVPVSTPEHTQPTGRPLSTHPSVYPSWEPLSTPVIRDGSATPPSPGVLGSNPTTAPSVSTTPQPSSQTSLILGLVIGLTLGCLAVVSLICWSNARRSVPQPGGIVQTQSTTGVWKYPPVQQQNPVMYENRYFQPPVSM